MDQIETSRVGVLAAVVERCTRSAGGNSEEAHALAAWVESECRALMEREYNRGWVEGYGAPENSRLYGR